jgi:multiple sugar transport system permease protein
MWTPFMILMTLAALGSVPKAELEAAEIDQIPWLKRIRYIILPNGKFILMLGILLRTIDAFKTTDLPYLMTNGGPGNTTEFVGLSLYRTGFEAFQMGDASALAIITLLIAIAFASIYLYVLSYRETRAQLK